MPVVIVKYNGPEQYMARCRADVPEQPEKGERFEWTTDRAQAFRFATRRIAKRILDLWWPNTQHAMRFVIKEISK